MDGALCSLSCFRVLNVFCIKFLSGRLLNRSFLAVTCRERLRSFLGRRGRSRFGAREWRVFFDVAGGRPFGEFGRVVFVGVLDDGVEDVQGNGGFVRGVFQSAGGSGLRAKRRALGRNGGFKGGDVRGAL